MWPVIPVLSPGVRCVGMTSYAIGRNVCEWVESHRKWWKKVVSDRRRLRPSMSAYVEVKKQVSRATRYNQNVNIVGVNSKSAPVVKGRW
jgi:hypothetical protein